MQVILSRDAQKHFRLIPESEKSKIKKKLFLLKDGPLAGKKLGGELSGKRSLKSWPYRIVYSINIREKIIEVADIIHRQGAYK